MRVNPTNDFNPVMMGCYQAPGTTCSTPEHFSGGAQQPPCNFVEPQWTITKGAEEAVILMWGLFSFFLICWVVDEQLTCIEVVDFLFVCYCFCLSAPPVKKLFPGVWLLLCIWRVLSQNALSTIFEIFKVRAPSYNTK